ncbi:MAG: hypothetical protein LJE94_14335 [Deltaproteobacteria bacterium]|nr:hypothetical protein [Deltaproteobacteria bacterium]
MQIDMHYYGTYALARTAGLKPAVCKTIALASQYVDDNAAGTHIEFQDGGRVDSQATAHHVSDLIANRDPEDQRQVWVPFHFLPGNEGSAFSERLLCRADSRVAKEMVQHHLGYAKQGVGIYLIGIAAHVYADTFSHFGFSGVGSRRNKVDNDSFKFDKGLDPDIADYIKGKEKDFFRRYGKGGGFIANIKSWLAETVSGALGHGAVATYPDRPYLKWSFKYEYPKKLRIERDNPAHFLNGCRALHAMFAQFAENNTKLSDGSGVSFSSIEKQITAILTYQAKKEDRIARWRKEAKQGKIGKNAFDIPLYKPELWMKQSADMNSTENSKAALRSHLYRFYQAASIHRQFVLRELLPDRKLIVA